LDLKTDELDDDDFERLAAPKFMGAIRT
jgi:hypothetical protein